MWNHGCVSLSVLEYHGSHFYYLLLSTKKSYNAFYIFLSCCHFISVNSAYPWNCLAKGIYFRLHTQVGPQCLWPPEIQTEVCYKECLILACPSHQRMELMNPRSGDQSPYEPLKPRLEQSCVPSQSCSLSESSCKCQPPGTSATRNENRARSK